MNNSDVYPRILPAGDRALIVEFGREISSEINGRVQALARALETRPVRGVEEVVPTYRSLMVCYHPSRISYRRLSSELLRRLPKAGEGQRTRRVLEVPCLYDGEDLPDMEALTGLPAQEIIRIHSSVEYQIYMLGFLPGFVYLGGLDPRICAPRLTTPRTRIPAGSVGIGGSQTGVYPMASPGGWRLIGRTPLRFYDPARETPILCAAGEGIRFRPIEAEEYASLDAQVRSGDYAPLWREEGAAR